MPLDLAPFAGTLDTPLTEPALAALIADHDQHTRPRLERLWSYYRNPMHPASGARAYRLAQEQGLPARLRARADGGAWADAPDRRESVIENDIAWRLHVMVDFLFGGPVRLLSLAADEPQRRRIGAAVSAIWERSGGLALLHDAALLAHVYGHVDLVVRFDGLPHAPPRAAEPDPAALAAAVRVEPVDPASAIALMDPRRRALDALIIRTPLGHPAAAPRAAPYRTEILGPTARQVYHAAGPTRAPELADAAPNLVSPGVTPAVRIHNLPQPLRPDGLGEVEPLIPLQDELNTRLSDRAFRITMQSFKMYLGKGIDGFERAAVGPGVVWASDNPDASITEFGGDADAPCESAHIDEIRLALDKASGVPPLAAGIVGKIGNLTSENALRVTLQGLLTRTARKRLAWARGIAEVSRLILAALDLHGLLPSDPRDRAVDVAWSDALANAGADARPPSAAPTPPAPAHPPAATH